MRLPEGRGRGGAAIEQIIYEGYGPGGVAMVIETATDNRQRTVSQVKNVLGHAGGTLVSPGGVNFLFERERAMFKPKQGMNIVVNEKQKQEIESVISELEALDDVQNVFTNI